MKSGSSPLNMPTWFAVKQTFRKNLSLDDIPHVLADDGFKTLRKLTPPYEKPEQTAGRWLIGQWEDEWQNEHPEDQAFLDRMENRFTDQLGQQLRNTSKIVGDEGFRAARRTIAKDEEAETMSSYDTLTNAKDLFVARKMRDFLESVGKPVFPELEAYIESLSPPTSEGPRAPGEYKG